MPVLTLQGKPYDWSDWDSTDLVQWSSKSMYGTTVKGSLRTIAHLDFVSAKAEKRFGTPITVIQPPFNTTVAASAGTHDYDNCLDFYISGCDSWWTMQRFWRYWGGWGWYRHEPIFPANHIHGGCIPVPNGGSVADDFETRVGIYVPGQLVDYYNHAFGLSGMHTPGSDESWFPADIRKTIFNLKAYAEIQGGFHVNEQDERKIKKIVHEAVDNRVDVLQARINEIFKVTRAQNRLIIQSVRELAEASADDATRKQANAIIGMIEAITPDEVPAEPAGGE